MIEYKNGKTRKEIEEELRQVTSRALIKFYIEQGYFADEDATLNIQEMVSSIRAPYELDDILEELGWIREGRDDNGWEQDTWYWYTHPDYDYGLTMFYSGFYGGLKLYHSDEMI